MNVTTEKVAEGQVALTIEVEQEAVDKALNQAYHRLVVKTLVPGFRKGKAPRAMLERYLGQGALLEEALQRLIPQVFGEVAKEQNLTPFAEPKYEVVQVEPVIVKATVDLPPEVELGSYKDIRTTLDIPELTDEDVDKAIEQVRESMAKWEPAERPVEVDDRIQINIRGTKDGEEFFNQDNYPYGVRPENPVPVPGFAEHLIGVEKGGEKEFDISFPDTHENDELAGHNFHFWIKVESITGKNLPPLDDDFAKSAGEGFENLETMRQKVRENMAEANERRAKEELVDKIVNETIDISKIEIPPSLIDQEVHHIIEDEEERFRRQRFSLSQYLSLIGKNPHDYHDELQPIARDRVKRSLVLGKLADAEEIKAEPSEIDAEIALVLKGAGEQGESLRQFFAMPEGREVMERDIVRRKTLRRMVEIATEGAVNYPEISQAEPAAEAGETVEAKTDETTQGAEPGEPEASEQAQE